VPNNSHLCHCAISQSRAQVFIYLIFVSSVTVRVMIKVRVSCRVRVIGLIIPTCRVNLVLRVIWQCDISGMTPAPHPTTEDITVAVLHRQALLTALTAFVLWKRREHSPQQHQLHSLCMTSTPYYQSQATEQNAGKKN